MYSFQFHSEFAAFFAHRHYAALLSVSLCFAFSDGETLIPKENTLQTMLYSTCAGSESCLSLFALKNVN
ncbi:hypothetical protein RJT34_04310 [Clitoria ternatea]|uniref:Uncharacterized protein n=1 Tax=Clitoria ternatea TaxID=43366 RepID=A0AAN9KLC9_CLITE